jgi:hypothetical protein
MLCHQFLRFLQIFGKIFDVFLKINVMSVFCLNRVIRVKNASNLDVFYAEIKAILLTPDELVKKNIIKKIKSSSKIGLLLYFKKKTVRSKLPPYGRQLGKSGPNPTALEFTSSTSAL